MKSGFKPNVFGTANMKMVILSLGRSVPRLFRSLIVNNTPPKGGALLIYDQPLTIIVNKACIEKHGVTPSVDDVDDC